MTKSARILIVDDHPALRLGLRSLLNLEADFEVCGEADNGSTALELAAGTAPDVVVLDISLNDPEKTGLDLIPELRDVVPKAKILVYSMHDEFLFGEKAFTLGANGYLMKQESVNKLIDAIRTMIRLGSFHSGNHPSVVYDGIPIPSAVQEPLDDILPLSAKEMEVLKLVGKGLQPREIAKTLFISVKTVETHRRNIRKKLGLHDAAELIRFALKHTQGHYR